MFCPKCGKPLRDGAKFCPKCGAKMPQHENRDATAGGQEQAAAEQPGANKGGGRPPSDQDSPLVRGDAASSRPAVPSPPPVKGDTVPPYRPPSAPQPPQQPPSPSVRPSNSAGRPQEKRPGKKNKKLTVALLILLLILVLAAGGAVMYYVHQNGGEDNMEAADRRDKPGEDDFDEDELGEEDPETESETKKRKRSDEVEKLTTAAAETTAVANPAAASPVTCSVMYANQVDLKGLSLVNVPKAMVSQSSYVVQSGNTIDNTGWSAFDGQSTTSWQEGVAGDGIGEFVTAGFDREYQVNVITFLLGNHRSDSWFLKNNRPKTLLINLDGVIFQAAFPDEKNEFALVFSSPVPASSVTVTIDDVYKGTQYTDTVISEIGVYGN